MNCSGVDTPTGVGGLVMICRHDDVAEWDGGAWGEKQCMDEIDGNSSQGKKTS